ncbi:UDP-N-acetylmuramoyl-L-alanyl-D-glutamate--L-lysine ligase [Clostridia bacterium]|nr:UDP-N-acetylmuramoyl-L-alanyl-D-glutamate--L-lysine ligase [Clostridia bacterium]
MNQLGLSLSDILNVLTKHGLIKYTTPDLPERVEYISHDSRDIESGTLFFCKGAHFDPLYLVKAVEAGAVCYMSETEYDAVCPHVIVTDIRKAISLIAPLFYGDPVKSLITTAVTGTKGKTTVAYFVKNILDEFTQSKTGLSSNIEKYTGKRSEESHINTPEPCDLQKYFYETKEFGIVYFTLEISSQAYKTGRVGGITFDAGIFLNVSEDHISPSEHADFEDYLSCKLELMRNCRTAVIHSETDCFERVYNAAKGHAEKIILFGGGESRENLDYRYRNVTHDENRIYFDVEEKTGEVYSYAIKMHGLFNVENAAAAIAISRERGICAEAIRAGLEKTTVPGRMTVFESGGITVIVDYAHNFLSFTKLYESLKAEYPGRRIISVGGAPGGKALRRRRDFAEIVSKNSDYVYYTAEDPQYEQTEDICAEMISYAPDIPGEVIPDREIAVKTAIENALPGDVVVLLAKGSENYQKVMGKWEYYKSDLEAAREFCPAGN